MAFVPTIPFPATGHNYVPHTTKAAAWHFRTLQPLRTTRPRRASRTPAVAPSASAASNDAEATQAPQTPSLDTTPFPTLYDAWFGPDHELRAQVQAAITRAHNANTRAMELQWPAVPNLEEIAAGTLLNFEFGKHVATELGMSAKEDYPLIKRYLASFCNLYWVREIADAPPFRDRTVWAISTDSISKTRALDRLRNVRLGTLRRPPEFGDDDVVVIIDPRFDEIWQKGMQLRPKNGTVIFLNSQFNESYGLTGPRRGKLKEIVPVYFLRRVTRGFVFFSYPGPWRACLEKPDMSIEELAEYEDEPKLSKVAMVVREESNNRYGGFHNDRYVRGFGGRL